MKIIYCASSTNINDLKTHPSSYASSKINTLFTDTRPHFIKEFTSISNIEYVYVEDYPDFCQIWNDMMNKITFAYNYKYLESKRLYDEYVNFNKKIAGEIGRISERNDLVIINDASLYLLPGLVNCRVAIRNIDFDESFIERVPYYREILREIMKVEKFFSSERGLDSFNRYLDSSYEFSGADRGGCHYMQTHVDKESVLDVLNTCSVYKNTLSSQVFTQQNTVLEHLKTLSIPKSLPVILTNVPLLHLEAYIKDFPRTNIRYIRSSVEIDGKQDRMVQYLKKAYNCVVDVIDKHDYDIIALEMFYCDIFVGSKYSELAKLLRKPFVEDDNDPVCMMSRIKDLIGKLQERACVYEEEQYLKEFMEINGYDILHDVDLTIDDQIDSYILELVGWINGKQACRSMSCRECGVASFEAAGPSAEKMKDDPADGNGFAESSSSISTSFRDKVEDHLAEMAGSEGRAAEPLYAKMVDGERVLFRRAAGGRPGMTIVAEDAQGMPEKKSTAESRCASVVPRVKKCCSKNGCSVCSKNYIYDNACPSKTCTCHGAVDSQQKNKPLHWPKIANLETIRAAWETSSRTALLDYDGTLSPIEKLPHLAKPTEDLFELLRRFNKKNKCIICTGRSMNVVDEWFPAEFEIYAEHGACHRKDGTWETENKISRIEECVELMEYYTIRTPGSVVEKKSHGCAFHYKNVKGFDVEKLYYLLKRIVGGAVVLGKGVIEVRSSSKCKITARVEPALVAGDDVVDEDMFEVCDGVSIRVGEGETKADFYVETVPDFLLLLEQLIE